MDFGDGGGGDKCVHSYVHAVCLLAVVALEMVGTECSVIFLKSY